MRRYKWKLYIVTTKAHLVLRERVFLLVEKLIQLRLQGLRHILHRRLDDSLKRLPQSRVLRRHLPRTKTKKKQKKQE